MKPPRPRDGGVWRTLSKKNPRFPLKVSARRADHMNMNATGTPAAAPAAEAFRAAMAEIFARAAAEKACK